MRTTTLRKVLNYVLPFFLGVLVCVNVPYMTAVCDNSSRSILGVGAALDSFIADRNTPSIISNNLIKKDEHFIDRGLIRTSNEQAHYDNSNKKYNFTTAICAIVKDSEQYLTEWIDYHLIAVGFDQIYIYDNSDTFELEMWYNQTRQHKLYNRVGIVHHPSQVQNRQTNAYKDCVRRFGMNNPDGPMVDYFALIDIDEFVYPVRTGDTIHDVLAEYLVPFGGALTMNWVLFGTSNRTVYSPTPVLKRFQYREPMPPHNVIKSIVKGSDFDFMRNPHGASLKKGTLVRTTSSPGHPHAESLKTNTGASDHERPSSILLLYHIRYTSVKEYTHKRCTRGHPTVNNSHKGCNVKKKTLGTMEDAKKGKMPDHMVHRPGSVFDDSAWRLLKEHAQKYQIYDEERWEDYF